MAEERRIEFKGTGLQALGWGLYSLLLSLLIIPAAWGAAALYRWFVRNLSFSDGTQASFEGRGGEVWGYFVLMTLLGLAPQLSRGIEDPRGAFLASLVLPLLFLPINVAIWLKIWRWFVSRIRLSSGTPLVFTGTYGSYLGWMLLVIVSAYTIVGLPWATVAMARWICRNIEGGDNELVFHGSGWGLFWRVFLAVLASLFVIPIPWVTVWLVRWFARNMLITKKVV